MNWTRSNSERPLHKYLWRLVKHKLTIIPHGLRLGVPLWMLLLHDWDKFLPWMISAYVTAYANGLGKTPKAEIGKKFPDFDRAWQTHVARNKHHWEYYEIEWAERNRYQEMPDVYRREMLADWRAMNGSAEGLWDWYQQNRDLIILHPVTRRWVESQLQAALSARSLPSGVMRST